VGLDYSLANIAAAKKYAQDQGLQDRIHFLVGDSAHLPFLPGSFETIVSNHVLEHLPDIDQGIDEVRRTMSKRGLLAVPTCLSPYAWPLLGGNCYWSFSWRSPFASLFGLLRVCAAFLAGSEGVNEGYAGNKQLVHIFRFPWKFAARLRSRGLLVSRVVPQCLGIPYVLKPVRTPLLQRLGSSFGFGTIFEVTSGNP
jgi:SAM-dependent methyltransferase